MDVIDGRDPSKAPKYIVPDYIQHSPSADHGLQTVMDHFAELWPEGPRAPGTYEFHQFRACPCRGRSRATHVPMKRPEPSNPGKTYDICWYDTYRLKDGMIIEHWDSALRK